MAALHQHWRSRAIERSEGITDAWEVTKTYAGRLAEWVLFLCMVMNIIEILPGVQMWTWLVNAVLGIQAVTLDVAGFGLATMAEQARQAGQEEQASRAKQTAYVLIGLMMITVLSISFGTLWPVYKSYTEMADKILILIRVAMTVWYGHVLHDLRQHTVKVMPIAVVEEKLQVLSQRMADLSQRSSEGVHQMSQALAQVRQQIAHIPVPEQINYAQLAEQIVPLLPKAETPNDEMLVEQIVTSVVAQMTVLHEQERAFHVASEKPRADPRPFHLKAVKGQGENIADDKQAFIREYLTEHPEASISTIMKAAQLKGITLSTGYISQQRKIFQQEAS